jgi:hypothetical protein
MINQLFFTFLVGLYLTFGAFNYGLLYELLEEQWATGSNFNKLQIICADLFLFVTGPFTFAFIIGVIVNKLYTKRLKP